MTNKDYPELEYVGKTDDNARDYNHSLAMERLNRHLRRAEQKPDLNTLITYYCAKHYVCEHDAHINSGTEEKILERQRKKAKSALKMLNELEEIEWEESRRLRKIQKK